MKSPRTTRWHSTGHIQQQNNCPCQDPSNVEMDTPIYFYMQKQIYISNLIKKFVTHISLLFCKSSWETPSGPLSVIVLWHFCATCNSWFTWKKDFLYISVHCIYWKMVILNHFRQPLLSYRWSYDFVIDE